MALEVINGVFYAVIAVPADVRGIIGRSKFRKTLKTKDQREAEQLAEPLIAEWRALIARARRTDKTARIEAALEGAERVAEGLSGPDGVKLINKANQIESQLGEQAKKEFYELVTANKTLLFAHVDNYLRFYEKKVKPTQETLKQRRKDLLTMVEHFKFAEGLNRKVVQKFFYENEFGYSAKTFARMLVPLNGLLDYLYMQDIIETEIKLSVDFGGGLKADTIRRSWADDEVTLLLEKLSKMQSAVRFETMDIAVFAAYTGARVDELCNLTDKDLEVHHGILCFHLHGTKTKTSNRLVPVHPELLTHPRLQKKGFLFDVKHSEGRRRAHNITSRFSSWKRSFKFPDSLTLHSFRHGFATRLQNAGVSVTDVANLLGHQIQGLTFGAYSDGLFVPQKFEAVKKLKYDFKIPV